MRLTISSLCVFFCITAVAQPVYQTYTPANGLVDARVTGMVQDKYGRIIIYTREGFSIYDGQRFTNILTINNEPVGIVTNYIFLPDSTLYLVRFTGNPVKVEKDQVSYDTMLLKGVTEISEIEKINDSTHLILSNHGSYLLINKNLKQLTIKSGPAEITLKNLLYGAGYKNKLLLCQNDGNARPALFIYDITTATVTAWIPNLLVERILHDATAAIYILTPKQGIQQIDIKKLGIDKIDYAPAWFVQYLGNNYAAENLFFDNENNIWCINAALGCYKINKTTRQTIFYGTGTGLLNNVGSIFEDKEKNYWFLTYGKGIQKLLQPDYEEIIFINNQPHHHQGYLYNLPGGAVFINGATNQYAVQDNNAQLLHKPQKKIINANFFWQNDYWYFTDENTLKSDRNATIYFGVGNNTNRFQLSTKIKTDKAGNILIGGSFFYLLLQNGKFASTATPYYVDNIVAGEENDYWVFDRGTAGAVLYRYTNEELVKIKDYKTPGFAPRCAALWNKDTFLIGTRYNGLVFVKLFKDAFKPLGSLTREKGLSNNFILDIVKLTKNKIALATASGVDVVNFTGTDTSIQHLSSAINVYDPISNLTADTAGNLYAISEYTGKLYKYTASKFNGVNYLPDAFFSGIQVNKEKVTGNKNIFNYLQRNFLFQVAAPSYIDNRNITFYFLLQGKITKELFNSTGDFEVNNLEPGEYNLEVKIVYPGNIYPKQKLFYQFTINQPFWQTWWFKILITFAVAILIGYAIRNFYSKKLQKQKAILEKQHTIEQERNRMARELHDGLGSMLSGIKHSFAALKNQILLDEKQDNKFHANIEKLNDTIKELRNISHSISPDGLLMYGLENSLRDYCNNITQPGILAINFKAIATTNMLLTEEQAFHIFRIVQELLQNIIKHSGASTAIVQISYNKCRLYITVEDDGRGFDVTDEKNKNGMGLKNIESRIKILKGKMDYRTKPSEGTSVLLEIPCGADINE